MALGLKGGFHFGYSVPRDLSITQTEIGEKLIISLPPEFSFCVAVDDTIYADTVIALHQDSSVLLSGSSGTVVALTEHTLELAVSSSVTETPKVIASHIQDLSPLDITEHIRRSGMLAENGRPFWRILSKLAGKGETLILNAVETEPGISAVHAVLRSQSDKVIGGLKILMRALSLGKAVIAMTESMHIEADIFRSQLRRKGMFDILAVAEKFPIEDSKVLFAVLTGSMSTPSARNAMIVTVQECVDVYDLFVEGSLSHTRVLTVAGKNFRVNLGTPITDLAEICGTVPPEGTYPHVGGLVSATPIAKDMSVTVGTKGVQYLSPYVPPKTACIHCGKCNDCCPVKLMPEMVLDALNHENAHLLEKYFPHACIGCGVCGAICPVGLSPREVLRNYFIEKRSSDYDQEVQAANTIETIHIENEEIVTDEEEN